MSKTSESKSASKNNKKKANKPKRVTGQNAGPQGFLVEHGEKAAFGMFGLIVVLCGVGAVSHELYTKTPEQLSTNLQQKRQAVQQNSPESFDPLKLITVKNYGDMVVSADDVVGPPDRGPLFGGFNPDRRIMRKRGEPVYLAVENLQAYPFNEAFAIGKKDAPAKKESAKKDKQDPFPKQDPAKQAKAGGKKKDLLGSAGGMTPGKGKKGTPSKEPGVGAKTPELTASGSGAPKWTPPRGGVDAPNAEAKAFAGVLVVGTIPRKKQEELYQREFELARDYSLSRDTPHYVAILIQRSKDGGQTWEQTVNVQTDKGPQERTFLQAYMDLSAKFAGEFPEIVDTSLGQYIVPFSVAEKKAADEPAEHGFTAALPPILGRDWDERVAGGFPVQKPESSERAFPGAGAAGPMGGGAPGGPPASAPRGGVGAPGGAKSPGGVGSLGVGPQSGAFSQPGELSGGGSTPQPGRPGGIRKQVGVSGPTFSGGGLGGGPPMPTGPSGPALSGAGKQPPGSGPSSNIGGPGVKPPGMGTGSGGNPFAQQPKGMSMGGASEAPGQNQDPHCDLLFRFFDLTAEEGQAYQYRVALVLENPNFGLTEGLLKENVLALRKEKYRYSLSSEPTAPVRISIAGGDVVAGVVRGARAETASTETATVVLRQRHRKNGSLVTHMFSRLEAGQVLNFKAQNVKYAKAVGGVETAPLADFEFLTDEVILDLKGGGDRGAPGELLLLDANGKLTVKNEVARSSKESGGHFSDETKRLEYIYNYSLPTAGASGGTPSFDDLLKGMK